MEDEITMTVELSVDEAIAVSSVLAYVSDTDVSRAVENNYGVALPLLADRNQTYQAYLKISEWLEDQDIYETDENFDYRGFFDGE